MYLNRLSIYFLVKIIVLLFVNDIYLFNKFWIGFKRDDEMVNHGFLYFPFFFFFFFLGRDLAAQS